MASAAETSPGGSPRRTPGKGSLRILPRVAHRILMVEDDNGIALPLRRTLEREGYAVERVGLGRAGLDRVSAGGVDLVVLDLGLPDVDGLDVCRQLRADGFDGGVLILTARGGELDRVVGLDVGADDYLAKPFSLGEFLARVRALLRRATRSAAQPNGSTGSPDGSLAGDPRASFEDGPSAGTVWPAQPGPPAPPAPPAFRLDPEARRAWSGATELALTTKEFDVLALLHEEQGRVVSRERLMDEVWDVNWFGSTKTLDVTVGRLRQKLEAGRATVAVVTVRGIGFRLQSDPPGA